MSDNGTVKMWLERALIPRYQGWPAYRYVRRIHYNRLNDFVMGYLQQAAQLYFQNGTARSGYPFIRPTARKDPK